MASELDPMPLGTVPMEAASKETAPKEATDVTPVKPLRVKELSGAVISPVSGAGSPSSRASGQLSTRLSFPGERSFSAAKSDEISSSEEENDGNANSCDLQGPGGAVNAQLERSLQSEAVELCLEVRGLGRGALYGTRPLFVALFLPGSVPGSWSELDRTERVIDPRAANRFVKKIRVPAATPQDREEEFCLAVLDIEDGEKVSIEVALGACKISLDELLGGPLMSMEIQLSHPRSGRRRKGTIGVSADLVPHLEKDEVLHFDFGFAEDAPNRNRLLFILSRAIPRGRWSPVYRSEARTKDNLMFDTAILTNRDLNAGNDRRLLRLEVYRYYKSSLCTLLGFCQTSLLSLKTCPVNAGIYWWPAQDGITDAKLILESRTVDENSSKFVLRVHSGSHK